MNARATIDEMAEYTMGKVKSPVMLARRKTIVGKLRFSFGRGRHGNEREMTEWQARWTVYGKNYSIQHYSGRGRLPPYVINQRGLMVGRPITPPFQNGPTVEYPQFNFGGWKRKDTVMSVHAQIDDANMPDILNVFDRVVVPMIDRTVRKFESDVDLPKVFLGPTVKPDVRYDVKEGEFRIRLNRYRFTKTSPGVQLDRFVNQARQPNDVLAKVTLPFGNYFVLLNPEEKEQFDNDVRVAARTHIGGLLDQ